LKINNISILFYLFVNLIVTKPIFVFGGSFLWGGGIIAFCGMLTMIYCLVSIIFLILALVKPKKIFIILETTIVIFLLFCSLFLFLYMEIYEDKWIMVSGSLVVLSIKWFTIVQIYRRRKRSQAEK